MPLRFLMGIKLGFEIFFILSCIRFFSVKKPHRFRVMGLWVDRIASGLQNGWQTGIYLRLACIASISSMILFMRTNTA